MSRILHIEMPISPFVHIYVTVIILKTHIKLGLPEVLPLSLSGEGEKNNNSEKETKPWCVGGEKSSETHLINRYKCICLLYDFKIRNEGDIGVILRFKF